MNDLIDEIYEEWLDQFMTIPLVQRGNRRNIDIERALLVNNQIITSMSSIRRHLELGNSMTYEANVVQELFNALFVPDDVESHVEFEDVKVTLSEEEFARFKTWQTNDVSELEFNECSVCIEEFENDDCITELPCKHIFHTSCIKNWLCREKVTCPSCRKDTRE